VRPSGQAGDPVTATLEIECRRLGRSGVELPRVALGCGNFGGVGSSPAYFGQGLSEDQAFSLMDAAWALGVTHFDTADAYGGGRSEQAIGRWIASRGRKPQLTTKTYNPMSAGADHGLAPARVERQLRSSLERLGVERVELYLAHDFDPEVPLADTLGAFDALRASGMIRAYGVSNFDAPQLEAATAVGTPEAIQNSHSLLERADEERVLPLCAAREVAYLAFGPLAGGWLTGKYRRDQPFPAGSRMTQRPEPYERLMSARTYDALERLRDRARERGMSMAGLALAWLLADDRVGQIVVGPGRPEHLEPVREALSAPLAGAERDELGAAFEA
jgi:aryl-alcohol dehydrogenase-like predicted oxidoreductase